jgi:phosphohistidine phosphatase
MKTLYVLRHAKSSWKKHEGSDRDRPLKKKGRLQADAMSDHLASLIPPPQHVLCSPAQRTRETLEYFLELWDVPEEAVVFPEALYLGEMNQLQSEICALPDSAEIAMVVGHNPGLTDLVHSWNTTGDFYVDSLRTCAFVQIDFQTGSWADLDGQSGEVKLNLRPKDLQA